MPDEIDDILDSLGSIEKPKPKRKPSRVCQYVYLDGEWVVKVPPARSEVSDGDVVEVTARDGNVCDVEVGEVVKETSRGTRWLVANRRIWE